MYIINAEIIQTDGSVKLKPFYCPTKKGAKTTIVELFALKSTKGVHINKGVTCFDGYIVNGDYITFISRERWESESPISLTNILK